MKTAFAKLLQVYAIDHQTIADCWQNIVTHYQQPHRHYHTLHHIQALLEQFDGIKDQLKQPESVLLAIFYHDVIYQTQGKPAMSNERQSAAYFIAELGGFLPIDLQNRVVELIIATEKHELVDTNDSDMAYFWIWICVFWGRLTWFIKPIANKFALNINTLPRSCTIFLVKKP